MAKPQTNPASQSSLDDEIDDGDFCLVDSTIPSNILFPSSPNTPYSLCKISLYVLRLGQPNDNWKIQIVFDNDIKYTFKGIPVFDRPKVSLSHFSLNI